MDLPNFLAVLSLLPFFFPSPSLSTTTGNQGCVRSCGNTNISYPFSFTPSCGGIHLTCFNNSVPRFMDFEVRNITPDTIILDVPEDCNRPVSTIKSLYSDSFAVTDTNTLLLLNCNPSPSSTCIPRGFLPQRVENITCLNERANATCVSYKDDSDAPHNNGSGILPLANVSQGGCSTFLSSISIPGGADNITLVLVQALEVRWWLKGDCDLCSSNAKCTYRNLSRTGDRSRLGINCMCNESFVGDGFRNGSGCQAGIPVASSSNSDCTNFAKYGSRRCKVSSSSAALLIAGIVCGAVLMTVIAAVVIFIQKHNTLCRSRRSTRRLLSEASCTVPLYPYREIARATDNFSDRNMLGTGAYGTVYVGRLHNDEEVAIKKLRHRDNDSIEQVLNEIKLLSSVSHPNLVRLLGCCLEREEQILVYEFMPNGTLSQHLQRERGHGLPWTVRLNIASDTAKAIAHLHSAIHPPIYHRDIKSSNILLDHNFRSKIADFGLSKMIVTESSHLSTAPQGTPGYLDPQYQQNFHLSDKSDVYSFGVVLVEIITAMKVVDFSRGQSDVNLAAMAINKIAKGCVEDIIDPFLDPHRDAWTLSSIHKVAELAFRCLAFHRDMRPSMMEVAEELEQIRMSGWVPADNGVLVTTSSSICSTPSNCTERSQMSGPLKSRRLLFVKATESHVRGCSPVSMDDPWRSEQSSPSADSLLGSTTR